jgi:putative FmdB family regulatory protein
MLTKPEPEGIDMPIYEYRCDKCGAQFEELTSSADAAQVRCRRCASGRVTRLLSTFAVGGSEAAAPFEAGPCGACGAPQRGMCGE